MFFKRLYFDDAYVAQRIKDDDILWKTTEKNLYYSYKNQNCILPTICGCGFFALLEGGFIGIIFVLLIAKFYCDYNNMTLDINPQIRKSREGYKNLYYNKEAQAQIEMYKEKWKQGIY